MSLANPTDYFSHSLSPLAQDTKPGRKVTPQGGTTDHTRETYRAREGMEGGMGERYNRAEHPSHAVAAQPHFATSILPARLHSHSVDPFTEGMSHMPPSASSPTPLCPSYSLLLQSPAPPALPPRAPPADPVSVTHTASLSILSRRPSLSTQAHQRLPPPSPPLFLSPLALSGYVRLSLSLARSCTQPKVSLSLRLCCVIAGR